MILLLFIRCGVVTKLITYYNSLNKILDQEERKILINTYNEWIVKENSIIDGSSNISKPHHVRTANNSGTGMKPCDLYQVPITYQQHTEHHASGKYQNIFLEKLPELHMRFLQEKNQYKILNLIKCFKL